MTTQASENLHSRPLGTPLPDREHACSVSMPAWQDVIDYEEGRPETLHQLRAGYPRFLIPPRVRELFDACARRFAAEGEQTFVFPSEASAMRCLEFLKREKGCKAVIDNAGYEGLQAVTFPSDCFATVKKYWQHSGEIVSSRLAQSALAGRRVADDREARSNLVERIAAFTKAPAKNILLYPSGMAAIFHIHRLLCRLHPGKATAQFGFAYLDTVKIQEWFGTGLHSFPHCRETDYVELEKLAKTGSLGGVFTELPTNPLLDCVDIRRLHDITSKNGIPLVVDDTIATFLNADPLPFCDYQVTSLTKSFSGAGDVMSGSLVISPHSEIAKKHRSTLIDLQDVDLWPEDAIALDENSRGFVERQAVMNGNAERLAEFLSQHPAVERVYYPRYRSPEKFETVRRDNGGWGALMSVLLKEPSRTARVFYDTLDVPKGPSLGTDFTLVCPYTMIAHYHELEWAENQGVSRWLVRVSVGTEPYDTLQSRFATALEAALVRQN